MKKTITLIAGAAALALGATAAQAETRQERGESKLAELIDGRVPGEAQSCITTMRSNDLQVIPYVGVVYEDGDTVYVARARHPNNLRDSDVPIFERLSGSRLCSNDVMRTVDRHGDYVTGVLFLEDFVPYTKPANG